MEDLLTNPLISLEEQLARQKGILENRFLVRKLPDKGVKLKESVTKLELELARRKQHLVGKNPALPFEDVGKLEWTLSGSHSTNQKDSPEVNDSDDDDILEEGSVESTFKIIAGSQISQRQAKPTLKQPALSEDNNDARSKETTSSVVDKSARPDIYVAKVVERDSHAVRKENRFVPAKLRNQKLSEKGTNSCRKLTSESIGLVPTSTSASGAGHKKWDECLLPPTHKFESAKVLSLEDSIEIGCEKYDEAERMKAAMPPKKVYAYERLQHHGLTGSVESQTARPLNTDIEDILDEEDDLSDDHLTEESESDTENATESTKISKGLSKLLNTSMKIT